MASSEVQKWADEAMFEAAPQDTDGPKVTLLSCNSDPLGSIAAAALAYVGKFVDSLAEITDEQRRHYLAEVQKTALAMPLESVNLHFHISGVTRGFTHQMVRQRTAAYSQESTRFAVKSTVPVGLPPSLAGTLNADDWWAKEFPNAKDMENWARRGGDPREYMERYASKRQKWRFEWDAAVHGIQASYNGLVNDGMPAEDARGLLPTNLLTQLNYFTSLRGLHDHAGTRLCTQAQFEWRLVWAQMLKAIRSYGANQTYELLNLGEFGGSETKSSAWQFKALADIFKPVCYLTGSCQFNADFDRKCSIRDRVDANASINRSSSEWHEPYLVDVSPVTQQVELGIPAIRPEEWLMDPGAAR